jgi:hypothetical protein
MKRLNTEEKLHRIRPMLEKLLIKMHDAGAQNKSLEKLPVAAANASMDLMVIMMIHAFTERALEIITQEQKSGFESTVKLMMSGVDMREAAARNGRIINHIPDEIKEIAPEVISSFKEHPDEFEALMKGIEMGSSLTVKLQLLEAMFGDDDPEYKQAKEERDKLLRDTLADTGGHPLIEIIKLFIEDGPRLMPNQAKDLIKIVS